MLFRRLLSGRFFLLLIFGGIAYWNFQTGHPVTGTVILAVVLSVAILWVPQPPAFMPFRIHIRPMRPFLFEFKMTTEEQLDAAMARPSEQPGRTEPDEKAEDIDDKHEDEEDDEGPWFVTPGHSLLRQGACLTMLKPPSLDGDFKTFSTGIDREFWFAELSRPASRRLLSSDKDCPGMHLAWTHEGLVISAVDTANHEEYTHGHTKRRAALIPWQEFGIGGWHFKKREALMLKNGWCREEDPDGIRGGLEELHHKYFDVYWNFI